MRINDRLRPLRRACGGFSRHLSQVGAVPSVSEQMHPRQGAATSACGPAPGCFRNFCYSLRMSTSSLSARFRKMPCRLSLILCYGLLLLLLSACAGGGGVSGGGSSQDNSGGGSQDGGSDGSQDGGSDGSQDGGSDGSQDGGSDGSQDGGNDGSQDGGSDGSQDGGNDGSQDGGNDGSQDGGSDGSQDGGSDGSQDGGNGDSTTAGAEPFLRTAPTATVLNTFDDAGFAARQRSFENPEYNVSYMLSSSTESRTDTHLATINAAAAYARGATGAGQKLMVVDTGIRDTHNEFIGKTVTKTTDSGYAPTDAEKFHGTAVSTLAVGRRDGLVMHGVAFDAALHVREIRLGTSDGIYRPAALGDLNDEFYAGPQWFGGFIADAVANDASVLNFSFGVSGVISSYDRTAFRRQLSRSAATLAQAGVAPADKTIIVIAAGNNGSQRLPDGSPARKDSPNVFAGMGAHFPELQSHILAVVALDQDGTIASYSNHCGIAKAFCFAAPGSDLVTASSMDDSGYRAGSGTSFAAPLVSGALLVLRQYFRGQLGNHELVDRLLATANREDRYADSDIYGHGLVDLDAATAPVGVMMTGLPGDPDSRPLGGGIALSGGAFGNALQRELAEVEIAGFDALGAPFFQSGAAWVTRAARQRGGVASAGHGARGFREAPLSPLPRGRAWNGWNAGPGFSLSVDATGQVTDARLAFANGWWLSNGYHGGRALGLYSGPAPSGNRPAAIWGDSPAAPLGDSPAALWGDPLAFAAPYLSLVRDGPGLGWSRSSSDGGGLGFALMHGAPRFDGWEDPGGERGLGALLDYRWYASADGAGLSLQAGAVHEPDGFLGARPQSAFGEVRGETTFAGVNGVWVPGFAGRNAREGRWRVLASAYFGRTRARAGDSGFVRGASDIFSSAFSLGAARASLWRRDDQFSLRLSQPLRVESGALSLRVPAGRTKYGQVIHRRHSVPLAPRGRILQFDARYRLPVASGTLQTSLGIERHPGHDRAHRLAPSVGLAFERRF